MPQHESPNVPFSDDDYACPCTHDHEPTLLSFEVMPPRKPSLEAPFWDTVDRLLQVRPDFMSVTYGAAKTATTPAQRSSASCATRRSSRSRT